jgi:hypothetical protein
MNWPLLSVPNSSYVSPGVCETCDPTVRPLWTAAKVHCAEAGTLRSNTSSVVMRWPTACMKMCQEPTWFERVERHLRLEGASNPSRKLQ